MRFFILISFFVISLSSCNKESANVDINNIKKELEVTLMQNVNERGPFAELHISTIDSLDCKNVFLTTSIETIDNRFYIEINGISTPAVCEIGKSKPSSNIQLPETNSSVDFSMITKNTIINIGKLSITENDIKLQFETLNGIKVNNSKINKIKQNSAWGIISSDDQEIISAFKQLIEKHKVSSSNINTGNYGLFNFVSTYEVNVKDNVLKIPSKNISQEFYFQYKNWTELNDDIIAFKSKFPLTELQLRNSINIVLN